MFELLLLTSVVTIIISQMLPMNKKDSDQNRARQKKKIGPVQTKNSQTQTIHNSRGNKQQPHQEIPGGAVVNSIY